MNFYEQLFCRGRTTGEGMTHFERLFAAKFGGSPPPEVREYTGAVPVTITADGTPLLDYLISGNMVQNGTPTPSTPIQPSECGERSSNLVESYISGCNINASGGLVANAGFNMFLAKVEQGKTYCADVSLLGGYFYNKPTVGSTSYDGQRLAFVSSPFTAPIDGYLAYRKASAETTAMMNEGNELLPYEPYGYKIPILSASTTTPVYLGEVETTRNIRKLVLTGEEDWKLWLSGQPDVERYYYKWGKTTPSDYSLICTHLPFNSSDGNFEHMRLGGSNREDFIIFISRTIAPTVTDFKSYLTAQYANGAPVTVWYVLATPQTAVVNEPLRKIGDYADTLSMEQAGVEIPTNNGTTVIDVDTELKPSEVYIKYMG